MPRYFFDSSALAKTYHEEPGSQLVDRILHEPDSQVLISRLAVVELQSVFAGKVRLRQISQSQFDLLRRRLLTDVTRRRFQVLRLHGSHYDDAERLIRVHGLTRSVRTLDALHLAAVLDVNRRAGIAHFVCADQRLCHLASIEGLSVLNPESP